AKDRGFLGEITDAVIAGPQVHGHPRDLFTINQDPAGLWRGKPHNHVKGSGFTGAVGPQQSNNLSLIYLQGNVYDYSPAPVRLTYLVRRQRMHLLRPCLGNSGGSAFAFYENPIIVTIESQRIAVHRATFGIKNARVSARQHVLRLRCRVNQMVSRGPATWLLHNNMPVCHHVINLAGCIVGTLSAFSRRRALSAWQ